MRRGAVLLELLVALAIFMVAATTILSTFGDVAASVERDAVTARAIDLARTRMSEIEAGLVTPEDLRAGATRGAPGAADDGLAEHVADGSRRDRGRRAGGGSGGLVAEAVVSRSAFRGLSLVEIRVFDATTRELRATLRQLVRVPRGPGAAEEETEAP